MPYTTLNPRNPRNINDYNDITIATNPHKLSQNSRNVESQDQMFMERQEAKVASISAGMGWFVVWTNPRCELKVVSALAERGYEHWMPTETRKHRRRYTSIYREVTHPLLTGYLFVRMSKLTAHWGHLRAIDGVKDVLGKNRETGKIVGITDREMAALRFLCESGKLTPPVDRRPYKPGQHVRVVSGPFLGFLATVDAYSNRESLRVLVQIFGRLTSVDIGVDGVEAV